MTRILKKDKNELLEAIKDCQSRGLNIPATATEIGITENQVRALAWNNNLRGKWPRGSAARDQRGDKNPNFMNGKSKATINRLTKLILLEVNRNLFQCERCGKLSNIEWPRHHIDRNRDNNSPENLEVLCHSCHSLEHISERVRTTTGRFVS